MADDILRLGVDPRPAEEGHRRYQQATERTIEATKRLSATVEQSARRETDIYRRAAADRIALERQLGARRTVEARDRAREAATAYVASQEAVFQSSIARIKEAQFRGLLSPRDAQQAGRQAAMEYNAAIMRGLDRGPGFRRDDQAYTTLAGSLKNVDEAARSGSLGLHRLNNSLVVLARQATGTHPIVGQLADVIGTFAIGTAAMVPVLAGIAAVGAGIGLWRRPAREAKEELEAALQVLRKIAEERDIEARGGPTAVALAEAKAEASRLAVLLQQAQRLGNQTLVDRYTRELGDKNRLIATGLGSLGDEDAEFRERMRALERGARSQLDQISAGLGKGVAGLGAAFLDPLGTNRADVARRLEWARGGDEIQAKVAAGLIRDRELREAIAATAERTGKTIKRHQEEEIERLHDLERSRERANRALIRSLENVGRAYGGVVDQVLSLVAATMALERMPMATTGDRVRGYATAGLMGIGYGQSTGSPALGALGGAVSGFSVAGPYGALVGGVTGIVSGLIEQGERAQRAAAQWKLALRDFEDMFTEFTPFEQAQRQIERQFVQLVQTYSGKGSGFTAGISSVEQARALLSGLQSSDFLRERYGGLARELDKLLSAYDRNVEAAREQADATDENTSALNRFTSALNSPSGLNLSYYEWLAAGRLPATSGPGVGPPTSGGVPPGGGGAGPNGDRGGDVYYVTITAGSGATFDSLMAEAQRRGRRGGGDPFFTVTA